MILGDLFTTIIYQPFFNILVFLYWVLGLFTANPDMGVGVVLLTIFIRILLLPLSISGWKGEAGRREIALQLRELELQYGDDRPGFKQARKKLFHKSRHVVVGELFSLFIQVSISLMLWRIFSKGLEGADIHLLYPFMPKVELPFNLLFLGKYDLSHPNLFLNFFQSVLIFIFETLSVLTSPYPPTRGEIVRLQLTLPVVSFLIFMALPAGKKLFVITTLLFSIVLQIVKFFYQWFKAYAVEKEAAEALAVSEKQDEKVLLETK